MKMLTIRVTEKRSTKAPNFAEESSEGWPPLRVNETMIPAIHHQRTQSMVARNIIGPKMAMFMRESSARVAILAPDRIRQCLPLHSAEDAERRQAGRPRRAWAPDAAPKMARFVRESSARLAILAPDRTRQCLPLHIAEGAEHRQTTRPQSNCGLPGTTPALCWLTAS